ncbi:AIPR family protein [Candidatus Micrarchaeota archaeon]|nr:AIPR family protein [Candidatus Micrarchaeota archaeon]
MQNKSDMIKKIQLLRKKYAIEDSEEHATTTVHMMNSHKIDVNGAIDRTSDGSNDHGIDGWYFDESTGSLYIYQSKLSESKSYVLGGLTDLVESTTWLEQEIFEGELEKTPTNRALFNLHTRLSTFKNHIKEVSFVLLSLFDHNELEDEEEYDKANIRLGKSKLNQKSNLKSITIKMQLIQYNLDETTVPIQFEKYKVPTLSGTSITLEDGAKLNLAYIPLISLVELRRRRGYHLFDKNVRLFVSGSQKEKERLVHPMEETMMAICKGNLDPSIFTFYHTGITISASEYEIIEGGGISLETPSIINGCQSVSIANDFLAKIEKDPQLLEKFKKIKVIAKIVVGAANEELKQIAISNNRQQPIDDWQLFSNDPVHIEIEQKLKEIGILYERQKGKYHTVMKRGEWANAYQNTNGSYLKVEELGQVIALSKRKLQWVAKPSLIFIKKENHNYIFDNEIPKYSRDAIYLNNLLKASRRALSNYISKSGYLSRHGNDVFKPIVRACAQYLAVIYIYQNIGSLGINDYSTKLHKKASPNLVIQFESVYRRIVRNLHDLYLEQSHNLTNKVSDKKLEEFVNKKSKELGIDKNSIPFSLTAIDWSEYDNNQE